MFVTTKHQHFSFHINNKNNLPKPENPIRASIESEVSLSFLKSALKKKQKKNKPQLQQYYFWSLGI